MQIGNKKTALKDNAALYTHETDGLSDREKMRSLKGRKKWIQFRDYYLLKIIAVVAVLAFIGSLLYTVLGPKREVVFYAAVCDMVIDDRQSEEIQKSFNEYIGIDASKQETMFDTSFFFKVDEMAARQKFSVYLVVGQISVALMPQSEFEKMAVNSCFKPLSEVLPTELYLKLADRFVMSGIADDNGELIPDSEKAYGLCVDGMRFFEENAGEEPVVLAVCTTWQNTAVCTDFIEFLLK